MSLKIHDREMHENIAALGRKPLLRRIYRDFHLSIARHLTNRVAGETVELGSGLGSITEIIPNCIRTDLVLNPWIDRVESAYNMSSADGTSANLILFDVFHHLRHPGTALEEMRRVLAPGGRLILFEPYMSLTGLSVYGLFHHEPVALFSPIEWNAPRGWRPENDTYYAAQGNATRTFFTHSGWDRSHHWKTVHSERLPALTYVASGGFSGRALYPCSFYPLLHSLEKCLALLPWLFATRCLVVLEKL